MRKKLLVVAGVALIVLLLAGLAGAAFVFAQEPTPTVPFGGCGGGWGHGGFGRGGFGWAGDGQWTMFDKAAEALGLTPEGLFVELHAGKSLAEIAEAKGVDMQKVYDAMNAARVEARKQAMEDGRISQEQADWMLQGLEKGWMGGHGFGRGFGLKGCPPPQSE